MKCCKNSSVSVRPLRGGIVDKWTEHKLINSAQRPLLQGAYQLKSYKVLYHQLTLTSSNIYIRWHTDLTILTSGDGSYIH